MKRVVFLRRLSDRVLEGLSVFLLLLIENVGGERKAKGNAVNNTKRREHLLFLRVLSLPPWQVMLKLRNEL